MGTKSKSSAKLLIPPKHSNLLKTMSAKILPQLTPGAAVSHLNFIDQPLEKALRDSAISNAEISKTIARTLASRKSYLAERE